MPGPESPITFRKRHHLQQLQKLVLPISRLKGIGPKRVDLFARKGIHTILDLLFFMPIRYEDRRHITPMTKIREGERALVRGRVVFGEEEKFYRNRKRLFRIHLEEGRDTLDLLWFQYQRPYLLTLSTPGTELLVYGKISRNRGRLQMIHPDVTPAADTTVPQDEGLGFVPVYSFVKGISANLLRSAIDVALNDYSSELIDPLPKTVTGPLNLPDLITTLAFVHRPPAKWPGEDLDRFNSPFHKRLLFDRFFLVMVAVAFLKKAGEMTSGPLMRIPSNLTGDMGGWLPFRLTGHQEKVVREIASDMASGKSMNRLLLGDVGCGKTAVATVAAFIAAYNGKQTAFMVPTRILAEQHMEFFSALPREMGFCPVLLTGNLKTGALRDIQKKIGTGACNLIIGTQALIQERIHYADLGLVIVDEQHRFGVRERASIQQKGTNPHRLVMTATPIPRTLAVTLYGDMDLSVIEGYPKSHRSVDTRLATKDMKREVFETVKQALVAGQQCFVICPAIEGSEENGLKNVVDMAAGLKKLLTPPYRVGMIHGRLDPQERDTIMNRFRKGGIDLLVGTTVLEVGIHVPGATVMVIEDPDRFGLAQLHQLRGRVGRGSVRGSCILMVAGDLTEKSLSRLKTLVDHHDGFEIAQKDLELRGQGELTGLRQSGVGELSFQEIMGEQDLFYQAREAAEHLLNDDPKLTRPENEPLNTFVAALLGQ